MSLKMRGQQMTLRFAMGTRGVRGGAMLKVVDWMVTPRTDLLEDDYIGEDQTDLDIQHNGFDGKFTVDTTDQESLDVMDEIIDAEENREAHPQITISAIYSFREPNTRGRMYVYHQCFVKADTEGSGGRKEKHRIEFSFKSKRRVPLNV
jgi:hypothetical protein